MGDGFEPDRAAAGGAATEGQGFASMGAALAPPVPGTPRAVPLAVLAGDLGRMSAPSAGFGAPGATASTTQPPPLLSLLSRRAACPLVGTAVPPPPPVVVVAPEGGRRCGWRCRGWP